MYVTHMAPPQCYDTFGNAHTSPPTIDISLSMGGLVMSSFSLTMSGQMRIYTATLPSGWFASTSTSGETVEVASQLNGKDLQRSSLQAWP